MIAEGRIQSTDLVGGEGGQQQLRLDKSGSLLTNDAHGRYLDSVRRGNTYYATNQAVLALSAASTTYTGLQITNPPGSGRILVLLELLLALATAPAGITTLVLAGSQTGAVTHTTPIVRNTGFNNAFFGGGAGQPVALVDSAATVPTQQYLRAIPGGSVATGGVSAPFIKDEIGGALILAPGACCGPIAITTAVSVIGTLTWEEISFP